MRKTRMFSKIAAMMLVAVMACCMVASAYGEYKSSTTSLYGNCEYLAHSTLYVDGGNQFRAGATVRTANGSYVGSGAISLMATLINASNGSVLAQTGEIPLPSRNYFHMVTTDPYWTTTSVAGLGWARVDGSQLMRLRETNASAYLRSANMAKQVSTLAESMLTEDGTYPVNTAGETYGSVLLADMVGEDPDLISATNQKGVDGDIRVTDVPTINPAVSTAAVQMIPLYDMNGNVIGSFELDIPEVDSTNTPNF